MATIAQYIAEINHQRDLLAGHLVARGIIATADEKLNLLVHKVSLLPSGSTEKTVVFDADHRKNVSLLYNGTLYSLEDFVAQYPDFCSSKNEYALNYSTSIFGWDYSCFTCSTVPLTLSAATQIAVRFLASSTESAGYLPETMSCGWCSRTAARQRTFSARHRQRAATLTCPCNGCTARTTSPR